MLPISHRQLMLLWPAVGNHTGHQCRYFKSPQSPILLCPSTLIPFSSPISGVRQLQFQPLLRDFGQASGQPPALTGRLRLEAGSLHHSAGQQPQPNLVPFLREHLPLLDSPLCQTTLAAAALIWVRSAEVHSCYDSQDLWVRILRIPKSGKKIDFNSDWCILFFFGGHVSGEGRGGGGVGRVESVTLCI